MSNDNPPKWHTVYVSNSERRFFIGLDGKGGLVRGRDKDDQVLKFRSVDALSRESGLTKKTVEDIINKYLKCGLVVNSPKNPELWGYWENCPVKEEPKSMSDTDKEDRVNKVAGATKTVVKKQSPGGPGSLPPGTAAGSNGGSAPAPQPATVP